MTLSTYDQIELFGLTETANDLPIPDDDALRDERVREAFDALIGGLSRTGLHHEAEPLAHGFVTLLHRRQVATSQAFDRERDKLAGLVRAADGSEVIDRQIDEAQRRAEHLSELDVALCLMAQTAAECYEAEIGKVYLPPSGKRFRRMDHLTGAVFEAREWLEAHEREQAERFRVEGMPFAVAGDRDWQDHKRVWETLDRIRDRFRERHATDIILCHKGDRKGIDAIAASWAVQRKVAQVRFVPNWSAFGKAAGFRSIDQMFTMPKPLAGVCIFGTTGIALNLADKAEDRGIRVMRVTRS